jgi:serralysin
MWRCIWDAGGTDELRYDGTRSAIIDLMAATLDKSPTGGGVLSYAANIYGGYTIANGVVVEKATGGFGADHIGGNDLDNILSGRDGADVILGRGGTDTLDGGLGLDKMAGGLGIDTFDFNAVSDSGKSKKTWDHVTDFKGDHIDLHDIDADSITANDQDFAFIGKAAFDHSAGEVRFSLQKVRAGKHFVYNTIVSGDVDGDGVADFAIQLDKHKGVTAADLIL